ncbi:MAG: PA14 domain-containing protein, partial [Kofleriaceae bacterium]
MRGLWLAACLGACFSPAPPLGAPCSDTQECPAGQTCDLVTNTCSLPTERVAWRDDAAEDFAQGTYLDEVTVESQGFLGPVAYYTGGLRVTGIESAELDNPDNADFEDLDTGELRNVQVIHGADVDYGAGTPPGFGFSRADDLTLLVEGELELEVAGTWRFQLTANDAGFVDLAAPGTHDFERVISDDSSTTVKAFNAPVAGWYRFRAAFTDRAMAMAFQLRYDPPNVQGNGFRAIPSDRLRARAGDITGLVVEGFEESFFIGHRATIVRDQSIADQQYATNPFELPIGTGSYSLRWTGQFLIDMPGDYAFSIDSRDGHRVWIDGA